MESNDKSETPANKLLRLRNSYLDLMQSWLTGSLYRDKSEAPFGENTFDTHLREHGLDWPAQAQTMIGTKRIANLRALTESVIADNVPGDFIETGVWRGGACILMRAVLYAHGITDRCVWVADSFEGLPLANELQYPADIDSDFHTYEQLAVSLEQVKENFRAYGLLDEQTKFLKGWFKDTLPTAPIQQLALIRLDGDMYESTMDGLTNLYPKLSHLGYVIIDDYGIVPACKAAVHDYCNTIGIQPEIIDIDGVGVYWRKIELVDHSNVSIEVSPPLSPDIQINHLTEHLIDLSKKAITYLNQTLVDRDGDIDKLKQTLIDRDGDIDTLKQTLIDRNGDIDTLKQTLIDRNGDIDKLTQNLVERNGDIDTLKQTLIDRNGDIDKLTQNLVERDSDIGKLKQTLAAVYSSTSWRITKPVRSIKSIINGSW
jgi:hypothetical protein